MILQRASIKLPNQPAFVYKDVENLAIACSEILKSGQIPEFFAADIISMHVKDQHFDFSELVKKYL